MLISSVLRSSSFFSGNSCMVYSWCVKSLNKIIMSVNKTDDDYAGSRNVDEIETSRKHIPSGNSGRKSWSLMDRKTDQEALQEMGVTLLELDDSDDVCDSSCSVQVAKGLKRKWDIENVNPNINSSPRSKFSPKSPRTKTTSPRAGPSKATSPGSSVEKHPLQPTELYFETSLDGEYLIDEETPLGQSVGASSYLPPAGMLNAFHPAKDRTFVFDTPILLGLKDDLIISRRYKPEHTGIDSFSVLSDEMILSIFKWLPKRTLAHCFRVCKRWHRLARDETLWTRLDLGSKVLCKDAIGCILSRKPIIIRLANSEIGEWHPTALPNCSRIQYLDLSMATIDQLTLNNLLQICPHLIKLSVEGVQLADSTCEIIGKCSKLETLNLTMAQGITGEGLKFILNGCTNLVSLNISWCNLDKSALQILVTMLPPQLLRLNIGGARTLTDENVESLTARCTELMELDISDCGSLTAQSVVALTSLQRLEHLATSRCYHLPPHALYKLASTQSLQYLEVWGMLHVHTLSALKAALPHVQINQFMFSAIARPTVGPRRTSVWGLRTRD